MPRPLNPQIAPLLYLCFLNGGILDEVGLYLQKSDICGC